ncbi:MAG: HIT domain-containing protein [Chloroflexota bacterium]
MDHLWAPWRVEYVGGEKEPGCVLCSKPAADDDQKNLVLHRAKLNFIMLNLFPYNPGHLMVAPFRHVGHLQELTAEETVEHYELVKRAVMLLTAAVEPAGFNVGMNLGQVAGAGVEDHIHTHIVPRWRGDSNFMPVIGNTKVVNESLSATYGRLKRLMLQDCAWG